MPNITCTIDFKATFESQVDLDLDFADSLDVNQVAEIIKDEAVKEINEMILRDDIDLTIASSSDATVDFTDLDIELL